ncbi:MAG: hypothetical protein ISR84_00065 [Kiritimatiellales bacterium]|nr:hypothetical protein [Kiritimatiellota bacterium]MBL7015931.1 hypothetical protein [Kiritimatiellales bacterium]
MTFPTGIVKWIITGVIGVALLALMTILLWSQRLQSSLESGRFEDSYTSVIHSLYLQTDEVRKKMQGNIPGQIEILSEEYINALRSHTNQPAAKETFGRLTLSGIYLNASTPLTEINGKLYAPGDVIGDFTIEEINAYEVKVRDSAGAYQTLRLIDNTEAVHEITKEQ